MCYVHALAHTEAAAAAWRQSHSVRRYFPKEKNTTSQQQQSMWEVKWRAWAHIGHSHTCCTTHLLRKCTRPEWQDCGGAPSRTGGTRDSYILLLVSLFVCFVNLHKSIHPGSVYGSEEVLIAYFWEEVLWGTILMEGGVANLIYRLLVPSLIF